VCRGPATFRGARGHESSLSSDAFRRQFVRTPNGSRPLAQVGRWRALDFIKNAIAGIARFVRNLRAVKSRFGQANGGGGVLGSEGRGAALTAVMKCGLVGGIGARLRPPSSGLASARRRPRCE